MATRLPVARTARLARLVPPLVVILAAVSGPARGATIGPGVREAVAGGGRARVVVSLRLSGVAALGMSSLQARVAEVQAITLGRLPAAEFRPTASWRAVPGLAGLLTAPGVDTLEKAPEVDRVDLDVGGHAALAASVPLIRADQVQAAGNTGAGVTVAVLDSGVERSHPDLVDSVVDEQCFCTTGDGLGCCPDGTTAQSGAGSARDDYGHGTNVTGIIASKGTVAPRGVAPGAAIVAVRVLESSGSFAAMSQIVSGLDYIITSHPEVRVVNMSLGSSALFTGDCDTTYAWTQALASAVDTLTARGTAVVAAAGNNGSLSQLEAPACVANTVSVGAVYKADVGPMDHSWAGCVDATTAADKTACFSNTGSNLDIMAPGSPIVSTGRGGATSTFSGTSQATPHVAGVFALAFAAKPTATVANVLAAMRSSGKPVTDQRTGAAFSRVDARAAVEALAGLLTYSTWVPVASHSDGINNTHWRTALGVLNVGTAQANLTLAWYASSGVQTGTTFVPAGSQSILDDVVAQIGPTLTGSAALQVRSDQPVRVTSRTYNLLDAAAPCYAGKTFGQDYPAVVTGNGLSAGQKAYLGQLTENADFRTNVAVVNTSTVAAVATVELHNGSGGLLTSYPVVLAAGEWKQETQPFLQRAGQSAMARGYAVVTVTSGSGIFAVASVIDNATGDPTTVWMLK
jgi:subtilisin family serine protease